MQSGVCMKSVLVVATAFTLAAASAAQAAPIQIVTFGQLVQAPIPPGSTPPDFAAPIANFSDFAAYWIIDPDAGTKTTTPLPAPSIGETISFRGSLIEFGAVIFGPGFAPLAIGNSSASLRQSFLLDNAISGTRATDQFSAAGGAYFDGSELVREVAFDRDLGENVFISLFQLSFLEGVLLPALPLLLDGDDFPDLGRLIETAPSKLVTLRFTHGAPTNAAEMRTLPQMSFNGINLNFNYIYLDDVETPEPAALGLFGLGLAALVLRRKRKA